MAPVAPVDDPRPQGKAIKNWGKVILDSGLFVFFLETEQYDDEIMIMM